MAVDKDALIRELAEGSLENFIRLVHPGSMLGDIHSELISWWRKDDAKSHTLVLLPRDHQKSRMAAYRVAWEITRNPAIRVMYVSSTSTLATKQVKFIKDILTSPTYRKYWPDMVEHDPGKREKWTETEFAVDHPLRKSEAIRDATVCAVGMTTNIVGLHCDLMVLDDIVTAENAYTETGREMVKTKYSLLASIEGADARELVVGTRYHPLDVYSEMMGAKVEIFDAEDNVVDETPLYDVFERVVEDSASRVGSGEFLWPRLQRRDGKWFGFNREVLAKKRAQYRDKTQYYAQYYNDPNDATNAPIKPEWFQYYDPAKLHLRDGRWTYDGFRLNVFAAMDFAYSMAKRADFTTIAVVGIAADQQVFVLDLDRFKADLISDHFDHLLKMYQKWAFNKIRAETTAGQAMIVKDLKTNYIQKYGLLLSVDEHAPSTSGGDKAERINAALQGPYQDRRIWHPAGSNMVRLLEDELVKQNPAHDDLKDALASVMDILVAPSRGSQRIQPRDLVPHNRFGGLL